MAIFHIFYLTNSRFHSFLEPPTIPINEEVMTLRLVLNCYWPISRMVAESLALTIHIWVP